MRTNLAWITDAYNNKPSGFNAKFNNSTLKDFTITYSVLPLSNIDFIQEIILSIIKLQDNRSLFDEGFVFNIPLQFLHKKTNHTIYHYAHCFRPAEEELS